LAQAVMRQVARRVVGQEYMVERLLISLLTGGHVLLEGVPGLAKTLTVRTLAETIRTTFQRIQFTPDLLPADVIGTQVYDQSNGQFSVKRGPIFANVILADEINRTTPRTQSALLEAMSDRQASIEGKTYLLPPPFIVLATQNPYDFEGTYVLPESQLDRFMLRLRMGYPIRSEERKVIASHRDGEPVDGLGPVLTAGDVLQLQRSVRMVQVDDAITDYLLDIVHATRRSEDLHVGVSTRGALTLYRAAQSLALVSGRNYVITDDVKTLTVPVLSHRVVGKSFLQAGEFGAAEAIIRDIVDRIRVPA